jgi:hypothetical protein
VPQVQVPKDWVLRGSGPQYFDVRSDRTEVLSGRSSVLMRPYDKDVPYTSFASLMQSVVAEPWLGQRLVFSVSWKSREKYQDIKVWIRAIDAGQVVIAYNVQEDSYDTAGWRKTSVAMDVPWSAAEIAYGIRIDPQGALWVDDAHIDVLDKNVPVAMRNLPAELGVRAQEAHEQGPLARPSNLDFEDIAPIDASFREAPKDALGRNRF